MTQIAITPAAARGRRPWRASASLFAGAMFGLLLGAAITLIIATHVFGFRVVTVTSASMAPAIRPGDAAIVRPVAIDSVEPGDVVLFEQGGDNVPVLHRVVGVNEVETRITSRSTGRSTTTTDYRLVTKGDSNPAPDPSPVGPGSLRGEVWFTIPRAGSLLGLPLRGALFLAAGAFGLLWASTMALQRRHVSGRSSHE